MNVSEYEGRFSSLTFADAGDGILRITLNNPGRLNSADESMHRDLALVWLTIDEDPDVRVVLVQGSEGQFSSGGDFDMIKAMIDDEDTLVRVLKEARDLVYNITNCSKPVVSAIEGVAVGAGLAVALCSDIPIAADNARLLDGHTRLGVAAGDHAVFVWPLLCGLAKAKYYLLTNTPINGIEASEMGLVAKSVAPEEVLDEALSVAQKLSAGSTTAVRWTKYALNNWLRMAGPNFDTSLALEFLGFRLRDVKEGLESLQEKRPPKFK